MFKSTLRYELNPAKPGTITLIPTMRTYLQALKPVAVVYGVAAVIVLGVMAVDKLSDETNLTTETDPETD